MHHALPWAGGGALAAALGALAISPVRVRLRAKARGDTLLRPRIDVRLLWGLVRLRPRVDLPRQPLRSVARRLGGLPGGGQPGPSSTSGARAPAARRATQGLQHAVSAGPAGRYLFVVARAVAITRLRLSVALHTGDPARTAIVAGATWGVLGAALAGLGAYVRFEGPPALDVRPLWSGRPRLLVDLDCILTARLGHVMVAAFRSLLGGRT